MSQEFSHNWRPSVHYAQYQTLNKGRLESRRLYDFELLYVSKGNAATEMEGKRYELREGDLIFLASGAYHRNEVVSTTASFIGIHFDFFDEVDIVTEEDMIVNENNVQLDKFAVEAVAAPFEALSLHPIYQPSPSCVQLMMSLVHEFTKRSPGYEFMCRGLMLQILTLLLRTQITKRLESMSTHASQIKLLMDEIQANPAKDWNNKLLAKRMNLHEDYMSKLFKQITGATPKAFVSVTRHHLARKLLSESNLSIETISDQVGYEDAHYFSRAFRKHEGISPSEYRKFSRAIL